MGKRHAVIDIGSNTVRLAIFTGPPPAQKRLVNRKYSCALAQDMDATGKLSPKGVKCAKAAVGIYMGIVREAKVASLQVVATAAVRDAKDGKDFVARLQKKHGIEIQILSGNEEARLSAQGVLGGLDRGDGMVVDLGGGSLELVQICKGEIGNMASAPLGHVRILSSAQAGSSEVDLVVERELSAIGWIKDITSGALFLSGGAWRKMARWHIAECGSSDPLEGYTLKRDKALRLADTLSGDPDRPKSLLIASRILIYLLTVARPEKIIFSTRGLSDGCLIEANGINKKAA